MPPAYASRHAPQYIFFRPSASIQQIRTARLGAPGRAAPTHSLASDPRSRSAANDPSKGAFRVPLETLGNDLHQVCRQLRKSPGFTVAVVLVLATGFGLGTSIFTAVRAVLLAPLPFRDPSRLVQIVSWLPKTGEQSDWTAPLRDALDWKSTVPAFQDVAMYRYNLSNLTGQGEPESVYGLRVTANLLPMLGVRPQLGEWFSAEFDRPSSKHVLLLSDDLWRRRFHADPEIVGKIVHMDDESYQVLGVMPKGFNFPLKLGTSAQLPTDQMQYWMPLGADLAKEQHGDPNAGVIARLKNNVPLDEAQVQLQAACQHLATEYPVTNASLSARLSSLREQTVNQVDAPLLALFAATGLLLLLCCSNIASLLLARGESHAGELAVRLALGASSWRVARLFILQGIVLCGAGSLAAVPLAIVGLKFLVHLAPGDVPRLAGAAIGLNSILFTAALAILSGILVGGVNAFQVLRRSPREILSEASRAGAGRPRTKLRSLLVVSQVALAVILVSGAGLMLRTFLNLLSTNTGYRPAHVIYAVTVLPPSRYPQRTDADLFYKKVLDRLRATPGIDSAAVSSGFPLVGQYDNVEVQIPGTAPTNGRSGVNADYNEASSGYLETMGVQLLRGRLVAPADSANSPKVAVIDQSLAQRLWPGQDAIGKLINIEDPPKAVWRQVVGIVAPTHNKSLELAGQPDVFIPLSQGSSAVNFVVVKSPDVPEETARLIRNAVSSVDSEQGVFFAQSMSALIQDSIAIRRFLFDVLIFFGSAALFLSALGIYALVAYIAVSRTREVGIRMALGATRSSIATLVVMEGFRLAAAGAAVGLAAFLLLARLLSSVLFGVKPADAVTLIFTVLVMGFATTLAALLPAWRSASLQPMHALRTE